MKILQNVSLKVIFMVTLIGAFSSCSEDELNEVPKDTLAVENLYVSTDGFLAAVNDMYHVIRREYNFYYAAQLTGTDVGWTNFPHPDAQKFIDYADALNSEDVFSREFYGRAYGAIAQLNLIIQEAQKDDIEWEAPDDRTKVLAEARFFRAYQHNKMASLYGDAVIVEEYFTVPKFDFVRSSKQEVLQSVKEDLIFAAANLPCDVASLPSGRLSCWVAKHLLSEVYIGLGEYDLAAATANDIIANSPHRLMKTRFGPEVDNPKGDVFRDLFREGNIDYNDGNLETIWVMEQEYQQDGGTGGMWARRQIQAFSSNFLGVTVADSTGGRGVGRITPTQAFLDLYEPNDIRGQESNFKRTWYYNDIDNLPAGVNYGDKVVYDETDPWLKYTVFYPSCTKWDFGVIGRGGSWTHIDADKDFPKYRLSETYLLLAEAQHLAGNNEEAKNALNEVRLRAGASAITAGDVDMDFILDERARELYAEEDRRLTLYRTGMFVDRVKAMNPQAAPGVQPKHALFPIPQSVIDTNVDAEIAQNPGY